MVADDRVTCLHDVSPAGWIGPRLHPFTLDTGSVIPEGFEAYCRIFHPVEPQWPETRGRRWADVAAENGRIAHPKMQFHMISRPVGAPAPLGYQCGDGPDWGSLPLRDVRHSSRCFDLRPPLPMSVGSASGMDSILSTSVCLLGYSIPIGPMHCSPVPSNWQWRHSMSPGKQTHRTCGGQRIAHG